MSYLYSTFAPQGYEPITTFWQDFSIAEIYGDEFIKDTAQTAFLNYCGNTKVHQSAKILIALTSGVV